jgi:hypothetical protein
MLTGASTFQLGGGAVVARTVNYGDDVALWTWKNEFMRLNRNGFVDGSGRLSTPEEFPRTWIWEHFIIEDQDPRRWWAGNSTPVRFGDKVYLRSWKVNWVSAQEDGSVKEGTRGPWESLTIESADPQYQAGLPVPYGAHIYLKTWRGTYLSSPNNSANFVQVPKPDSTCLLTIYDRYGQGQEIDWASRGTASQSSTYEQYLASNAIDGNPMSFSHTQEEQGAWWRVELPRDVRIDRIQIVNRKDCCQGRINNFDVIIANSRGTAVDNFNFKDVKDVYNINGVNKIGRSVKIALNGKNFLHLGEVRVYGTPISYGSEANTPVMATLLTQAQPLTEQLFSTDSLPHVTSRGLTLSLMLRPESASGLMNIASMGDSLHISAMDLTPRVQIGDSTVTATSNLVAGGWNHLALVYRPAIVPANGWRYGGFSKRPTGLTEDCCYAVHTDAKEYYFLKTPGPFAEAKKEDFASEFVDGMRYAGELDNYRASLKIFLNGMPAGEATLKDDQIIESDQLVIGAKVVSSGTQSGGADEATTGSQVNMLRFYNYAISDDAVGRDAQMRYGASTVELLRGENKIAERRAFPGNMLPEVSDQVSISMWLKFERFAESETPRQIYAFARVDGRQAVPQLVIQGATLAAPIDETSGIRKVEPALNAGAWYHIVQVLDKGTQTLYLNGVQVAGSTVPATVTYGNKNLYLGNIQGAVKDLRFHNYALSAEEVRSFMGVPPDAKYRDSLRQMWREQGCSTDLFEDPSQHADLLEWIKAGQQDRITTYIQSVKTGADTGKADDIAKCYGNYARDLYTKTRAVVTSGAAASAVAKTCLPTAPFTCKKSSINDFDIRTHRDFHKYANALPEETRRQLDSSRRMASNILQSLSGMDERAVDNIIREKRDISQRPEFRSDMARIQSYIASGNEDIKTHPEFQQLVQKLNQLNKADVETGKQSFQDFRAQSERCANIFERCDSAQIPTDVIIRVMQERSDDPAIRQIRDRIVAETAGRDSRLGEIIRKAQDENYVNSTEFQTFLFRVTQQQLKTNKEYQKLVIGLLGSKLTSKYADDMRRQCLSSFKKI